VSAEDRLRRYLEQRRELGESELVLDGMSVEEVMRIIGAIGTAGARSGLTRQSGDSASPAASADTRPDRVRDSGEGGSQGDRAEPADIHIPETADWREALRAVGADKPSSRASRTSSAEHTSDREKEEPPAADPAAGRSEPVAPPATAAGTGAGAGSPPPDRLPIDAPQGIVVGDRFDDEPVPEIAACNTLEEVAQLVASCRRCDLYRTALNPVPGEGSPNARLMCIGEAPGAKEDETGRPFVGAAGELLTKILAAINLRRDEVFIANVLKHRPPGNRNPLPEEVEACKPYLVRQVALIRPKVIITFGAFAAQTLLETKLAIGKLRGAVHRYHGIPVVVTYHPAALLRNPAWKRPTWEDVQLARRILDNSAA
jgi:DNA polymerase